MFCDIKKELAGAEVCQAQGKLRRIRTEIFFQKKVFWSKTILGHKEMGENFPIKLLVQKKFLNKIVCQKSFGKKNLYKIQVGKNFVQKIVSAREFWSKKGKKNTWGSKKFGSQKMWPEKS